LVEDFVERVIALKTSFISRLAPLGEHGFLLAFVRWRFLLADFIGV